MEKNHPQVKFGKTGVLLINLGTPDSTSWWDIRKYLKEFLSDTRVIEVNPIIWKIILNVFILTLRPSKTAHAYKKIWLKETDESPLRFFTRSQAKKLKDKIGSEDILVDYAMRYGKPSINSKLNNLKSLGCENLIILPREWLTPYTDKTLESLPKNGIKNLLVICPGFASDCVETLEEIDIQGREIFLNSGGKNFDLIPCLNDSSDHIDLFEKLISKYI